jgi:hypothetical protein
MLRPLFSKQVEESQRVAKENRDRDRQREQEKLKERAKADAIVAEKTSRLRALRLAKEAAEREELAKAPPVEKPRRRKKTPIESTASAASES